MNTIVVGYVPTPAGEAALEAGISEARIRGAELIVLHSSRGGNLEGAEDIATLDAAAESIRSRLADEAISYRLGEQVLGNRPAEDIVAVARDEEAELIVIGLRNRSLVGKLILGSNAQEVLMNAPCPVLTVHSTEFQKKEIAP